MTCFSEQAHPGQHMFSNWVYLHSRLYIHILEVCHMLGHQLPGADLIQKQSCRFSVLYLAREGTKQTPQWSPYLECVDD